MALAGSNLESLKDGDRILGKLNCEVLGLGNVTASSCKGKSYLCALIRNGNNKSAVNNECCCIVGNPCEGYVVIVRSRKCNYTVSSDGCRNLNFVKLSLNLLCGSLLSCTKVLEAIYRERNEVRIVVVKNYDTVNVSSPVTVSRVSCIDCSLSILCKSGGEISNVGSDVGLMSVKLEVEVIRRTAELLCADGYALNYYRKSCVLTKVVAVCEVISNVNEVNSLDSGIDDLCLTALDLHHAGVRSSGSVNENGHTNLDAKISNGILIHLVGVVTAYYVKVCKEEVVSGVTSRLRVDSNNDTHNGEVIVLLSVHVLFEGVNSEYGNGVLILSGEGLALLVSYCEGKGIIELLARLGNNDLNKVIGGTGFDCYSAVAYFPLNLEILVSNGSNCDYFVRSSGNLIDLFCKLMNVVISRLKIGIGLGIVGICLTALALTVYEIVLVRRNIVGICLATNRASALNKLVCYCSSLAVGVAVTAEFTSMSCKSFSGTCGIGHLFFVLVYARETKIFI